MLIGTVVMLRVNLGTSLKRGMRGVCYSRNNFMDTFYVIFENGRCAGFESSDLAKELSFVYLSTILMYYEYERIDVVHKDFKAGIFKETLQTVIN